MNEEFVIGTLADTGSPAALKTARFNRHTFWCGQSGSGKTYALGVVLERLLLHSGLPLIIFDPNSDFIGMADPRHDADPEIALRLDTLDIRVFRPRGEGGAEPLTVRVAEMDFASRAAVLRLDPVHDAEEYQALRSLHDEFGPQDATALVTSLMTTTDPARRRLSLRIQNLGVIDWDVWARGAVGVENVISQRPDATILDLGGFRSPDESAAAALAVLDRLWERRSERRPVLLVIDEAHNLCPPEATTPVRSALLERVIQIAAEGRKFGLWLLLSTQRPSKVHPQVLSQCDNLCVMKTNAPADIAHLAESFGAVPRHLLDRAPKFSLGQALFAGGFVSEPAIVQMADRYTREGGSDVSVPLYRISQNC